MPKIRCLLLSTFSIAAVFSMPAALSQVVHDPMNVPLVETPDKELIPASPDANKAFTPLVMPSDAAAHGISLSGEAKMYRIESGKYQLGEGCVLVHVASPLLIKTCRANIHAEKGAAIVVSAHKDATTVMNLSDHKQNSVLVMFDKSAVSLRPGEELVIAKAQPDAYKPADDYVIRHRNPTQLSVSPMYKTLLLDFSLADAMRHCLIFRQLTASPRKEDKVLLAEMIKTAAAVNTMYKARGKYTHGPNGTVAAGNKRVRPLKDNEIAALSNTQSPEQE